MGKKKSYYSNFLKDSHKIWETYYNNGWRIIDKNEKIIVSDKMLWHYCPVVLHSQSCYIGMTTIEIEEKFGYKDIKFIRMNWNLV